MSTKRIMQQILELMEFIKEEEFGFDDNAILAEDHVLELINELHEELKELEEQILDCEDQGNFLLQEFICTERDSIQEFLSSLK